MIVGIIVVDFDVTVTKVEFHGCGIDFLDNAGAVDFSVRVDSQIASRVFSLDDDADPKAIETYIHRLHRKTAHPALAIETVRGLGYRLRTFDGA